MPIISFCALTLDNHVFDFFRASLRILNNRPNFQKVHYQIHRLNPNQIQVTPALTPRINQLMMSFTLLTFTNSFPDMVTSILMAKDKEEGPLFSIASLFATYIFQTTITIAFVIYNSNVEVQVVLSVLM